LENNTRYGEAMKQLVDITRLKGKWFRVPSGGAIVVDGTTFTDAEYGHGTFIQDNAQIRYNDYVLREAETHYVKWTRDATKEKIFWIRSIEDMESILISDAISDNESKSEFAELQTTKILEGLEKVRSETVSAMVIRAEEIQNGVERMVIEQRNLYKELRTEIATDLNTLLAHNNKAIQESSIELRNVINHKVQELLAAMVNKFDEPMLPNPRYPATEDYIKTETKPTEFKGEQVEDNPSPNSFRVSGTKFTQNQETRYDSAAILNDIKLLSNLKFKELDDAIMIQRHIQVIENQLETVGLLRNGTLRVHLQNDLCHKFFDSLKNVPSCHTTAKMIGHERNNNWNHLKTELIRRVASKDKQREVMDKRMSELTFPGWQQTNEYIENGTRLYMMIRSVYGENEESRVREFVNMFIKKIPNDNLKREIIQTIRRSGNDHTDWELRLPFADYGINMNGSPMIDISGDSPTICSVIQEVIQVFLVSRQDREEKEHQDKRNRSSKPTPTEQQRYIILDMGDQREEHLTKKLQDIASTNIKSVTSKDGQKRIVFESGKQLQELKEQLEGCRVTIFKNLPTVWNKDKDTKQNLNYTKATKIRTVEHQKVNHGKQLSVREEDEDHELIIDVALKLKGYFDDTLQVNATIDTGAGRSYLIIPKTALAKLPGRPADFHVSFANGTTSEIKQSLETQVTIQSLVTDKSFQRDCTCYIMQQEEGEMQLLLGRDLISKFNMVIHGINYISIEDNLIYEREQRTLPAVGNPVYLTRGHIKSMELPQTVQKEYKEDLIQFEDQEELQPQEVKQEIDQQIDIRFEITPDAPFGRPILKVPWRSDERPPVNFKEAFIRDKKTSSKLTSQERLLYQEAVSSLVESGHANPLEQSTPLSGHYIAVRPVFKTERTTTKCRLCLDARLLNQYTHTGTVVSDNIIANLLEFRSHSRIAVFDLSKAFWQVEVDEQDRHFFSTVILGQRFQFSKMIFGGSFSPSGLEVALRAIKGMALEHLRSPQLENEPPRPTRLSYINYVDDFLVYEEDDENLKKQVTWLRWYLNQHGFPSDKVHFARMYEPNSTYLGYRWDVRQDLCKPKSYVRELPSGKQLNRRDVTSLILSLYDPLGVHLRLQLAGRQLLREICSQSRNGDKSNPWKFPVDNEFTPIIEDWMQAARNIQDTFPRHAKITEELFVFADSSNKAWVVEIYNTRWELIMAKGGLLPLGATIPRGELLALYQAVWLVQKHVDLFKANGMKQVVCLTDNEPNIHRLRNDKLDRHLPLYERNRVQQIRKLIYQADVPIRIQHIPGALNLADYATRFADLSAPRPAIDRDRLLTEVTQRVAYSYPDTDHEERLFRVMLRSDTKKKSLGQPLTNRTHATDTVEPPNQQETSPEVDPPPQETEPDQVQTNTLPTPEETPDPRTALIDKLKINQTTLDPDIRSKLKLNESGLLADNNNRVYINSDQEVILELMKRAHEPHHNGVNRTKYELRQFYWKNKLQDITKFVGDCQTCCQTRQHKVRTLSVGKTPWDRVARTFGIAGVVGVDICQGVDTGTHLLTVVCAVSKWIRAAPIAAQTATEVIDKLRTIFETTVFPRVIVSDGGPCFKSVEFGIFCKLHGISQLMGPSHASTYNGWFERSHQTILSQLRLLRADEPLVPWETLLPTSLHLINSRPYDLSDGRGLSPIKIVYSSSKIQSGILHDAGDSEIIDELKESGLDHLLKTLPPNLQELVESMAEKRHAALEGYLEIFAKNRVRIQERLREEMDDQASAEDYIPVGSWVRVYKPASGKLTSNFSLPQEVVGKPSEATRHLKAIDGKVQLEYLGNLVPWGVRNTNQDSQT